ncbi:PTS sugar transporter subunit IIA [Tractidigestivibacter sp.]|uniref:PTS sugar transporter subunit IIA n=1 Tax=Tractidigestivibacter sp. TaxID=2847320 RepID=UPI002A917763|nr:PTS sugar transporter subunit IIA [Tractidigestivibacter sp.]MDY5271412.1 PTS sugar transporter subunit IIA [Tractidigestivibacter sp.]
MLLKEIVEKRRYAFTEGPLDWRQALRECCKPLEEEGLVDPVYADVIIKNVEKHGPYIVLVPGVAMPHTTENAQGCNGTGIGFMRCAQPVHFDEEGHSPEKDAQIFFTLCSTNQAEHFQNMQRLMAVLTNDEAVEKLKSAITAEDLLAIDGMVDESFFVDA